MSLLPTPGQDIPLHVVLDFDGTITKEDTIGVLAEIALTHRKPLHKDLHHQWAQIIQSYTTDLDAHRHRFSNQTVGALERTPDQELCLADLAAVELRSINRVSASQIFQNIDYQVLRKGAEDAISRGKVTVREGFKEFVERVRRDGGRVDVLSVNWSREWIRAVLEVAGLDVNVDVEGGGSGGGGRDGIGIMANQIDVSSGAIVGPPGKLGWLMPQPKSDSGSLHTLELITTAKSKLHALKILHLRCQYSYLPSPSPSVPGNQIRIPTRLVYIGDSPADLDGILVADLAIVMLSPSTAALKEELGRMGYGWRFVEEVREEWGGEMDARMLGLGVERGMREKVAFWGREFRELSESIGLFRGGHVK